MPETQQSQKINPSELPKKRGRSTSPPFPRNSLKQCVELAQSIEKNNAGEPFDRLDLAKSLNYSPNSSGYRTLIISCGRYGLTEGGYIADKIGLTKLGSSIVAPTADDNPNASLRQALTTPDIFKRVYEKFNKKNIPREDVLKSTLRKEYGIEQEDVDFCYRVIIQNIEDYGLAQDIGGNKFLNMDKLSTIQLPTVQTQEFEESPPEENPAVGSTATLPQMQEEKQIPKQIFVAHGKNTKPLEQLKEILDQFKVPYKVAIDEANAGRPVSKKVSDLMRECSSAIFIFTKDEETKTLDGQTVYRPSGNVVFELGAASVLYENKIVIFKENGVSFGSDFKDLGYIPFDTDQLGAKTVELMRELINFGLLKISAA